MFQSPTMFQTKTQQLISGIPIEISFQYLRSGQFAQWGHCFILTKMRIPRYRDTTLKTIQQIIFDLYTLKPCRHDNPWKHLLANHSMGHDGGPWGQKACLQKRLHPLPGVGTHIHHIRSCCSVLMRLTRRKVGPNLTVVWDGLQGRKQVCNCHAKMNHRVSITPWFWMPSSFILMRWFSMTFSHACFISCNLGSPHARPSRLYNFQAACFGICRWSP